MIKASIYIPAYNAEKTITEVLDSVFNQSIPFEEVIVVNDCSNDNTLNCLKSFKNLNIINNYKNKGLSYCRNIALEKSKNEIVASIDSGVVLDKLWLEKISNHLKNNIRFSDGDNSRIHFNCSRNSRFWIVIYGCSGH